MPADFQRPTPPLAVALGSLVSAGLWLLTLPAVVQDPGTALAGWRGGPFAFAPFVTLVLAVVALRRCFRLRRHDSFAPKQVGHSPAAGFKTAWAGFTTRGDKVSMPCDLGLCVSTIPVDSPRSPANHGPNTDPPSPSRSPGHPPARPWPTSGSRSTGSSCRRSPTGTCTSGSPTGRGPTRRGRRGPRPRVAGRRHLRARRRVGAPELQRPADPRGGTHAHRARRLPDEGALGAARHRSSRVRSTRPGR
jgi:hypothetical protein